MKKRNKPKGQNDWVKKLKAKAVKLDNLAQRKESINDQRRLPLSMCY
jgi:hypothetical protein